MVDNADKTPAKDNIRTLIYHLGLAIDERLLALRKGTIYENARSSDARVFVTAGRQPSTISEIARELKITRQAAQMSVQRLIKLHVVEAQSVNGRDKRVVITPKGHLARNTAARQIEFIEKEFAAVLGEEGLRQLRDHFATIIQRLLDHSSLAAADPDLRHFKQQV